MHYQSAFFGENCTMGVRFKDSGFEVQSSRFDGVRLQIPNLFSWSVFSNFLLLFKLFAYPVSFWVNES